MRLKSDCTRKNKNGFIFLFFLTAERIPSHLLLPGLSVLFHSYFLPYPLFLCILPSPWGPWLHKGECSPSPLPGNSFISPLFSLCFLPLARNERSLGANSPSLLGTPSAVLWAIIARQRGLGGLLYGYILRVLWTLYRYKDAGHTYIIYIHTYYMHTYL